MKIGTKKSIATYLYSIKAMTAVVVIISLIIIIIVNALNLTPGQKSCLAITLLAINGFINIKFNTWLYDWLEDEKSKPVFFEKPNSHQTDFIFTTKNIKDMEI